MIIIRKDLADILLTVLKKVLLYKKYLENLAFESVINSVINMYIIRSNWDHCQTVSDYIILKRNI